MTARRHSPAGFLYVIVCSSKPSVTRKVMVVSEALGRRGRGG